jgi:hypothetical protein
LPAAFLLSPEIFWPVFFILSSVPIALTYPEPSNRQAKKGKDKAISAIIHVPHVLVSLL